MSKIRTVNCKFYGYKAKLVIDQYGEYKGLVYIMRDPAQGRSWKSIVAHPHNESRSILQFVSSLEEAVNYVAGDE